MDDHIVLPLLYDTSHHEEDVRLRWSHRTGMLLNAEELVALVHPPSASVRVEKLKRQERKTKAAPAIATGKGLILGTNVHAAKAVEVALDPAQRSRHVYVVGASGTGKSTMLLNLIAQDLAVGNGVAVLDPHGDLVDAVVDLVPDERLDDVILLDPADAEYPIGFNILSAHSDLERTLLASDLVAVFRRLSTSWGDQMTSVLGNAILAFLESDVGGTLIDLRRFLIEKNFREEFLRTVRDPDIVYYWRKEFPLLERKPQAPILTRLDTFLRPKPLRYMVAQKDDRLDFRRIMDEGKILLARLSQGAIGDENAYLLGTLLVGKMQQVAVSRQDVAESERRPFYVYVDEFHHFVTPTMEQILSGARKYRLGLILAHQDLRQISSRSPDVLHSVLTNPFTRVCFRVGDQDARTLADGFGSFDAKDLQNLGIGQAVVRVERADFDFNLDTPPLSPVDSEVAERKRERVTTGSRARYARKREDVEAVLRDAMSDVLTVDPFSRKKQDMADAADADAIPVPKPPASAHAKEPSAKPTSRPAVASPPPADLPPSSGRGGPQHRYLQELLKRWGRSREWRVEIEEKVLDGLGNVDVALRKGDHKVACEIAVTTTAEHELENIQKCIAAGFDRVICVSPEKKTLTRIKALASSALSDDDRERVHFCTPEEAFACLENVDAETAETFGTFGGYTVRAKFTAVKKKEGEAKRQIVSGVLAKALKRLRRDK